MASKNGGFRPVYSITSSIASGLMRIEALRHEIEALPITPRMLASLRESAKLSSTHYSTAIEGNLLTQLQASEVIAAGRQFPGRERDQQEVLGYYAGLGEIERLAALRRMPSERELQGLHALVMGGGKRRGRPTPYRSEQNVIRDSRTQRIVYMPPEAKEVPGLMAAMLKWTGAEDDLPVPLRAAIVHYQYATIHPYYDGNGRTARLLTTLVLHLGGYGLKGLYALEEHYARNLKGYYEALTVGPSHNYHLGRAEADITGWIGYFIAGMAASFESVHAQASREAHAGGTDRSQLLRRLELRQRTVLTLFERSHEVTAKDIARQFGIQQRAAGLLCQRWVAEGFLVVADAAKKTRRYRLAHHFEAGLWGLSAKT